MARFVISLLMLLGFWGHLLAQSPQQPTIMVIPYTKSTEDIRTVLEADENKRIILTKVKEGFDLKGVNTIDFVAKLKAIESGQIFNSDNKSDIKSMIIDMSGADIYVEAEISYLSDKVADSDKPESRVKLILTAYDASTGQSLANKVGDSGVFYTRDIAKLGLRATMSCIDDFLSVLQMKFIKISEEGRSVMLQLGFDIASPYTMESIVGTRGLALQDEIELWVESKAHQGAYHLQGVSKTKMIFDDIKLSKTPASRFALALTQFLASINLKSSRDIRGNTIYITIK